MRKADQRVFQIERVFGHIISNIEILDAQDGFLKLILHLKDSSTLRITENWIKEVLEDYSYYWLNKTKNLIIGWDNAPHHKHINTFPHHKHISTKKEIQPSIETSIEKVLKFIENTFKKE